MCVIFGMTFVTVVHTLQSSGHVIFDRIAFLNGKKLCLDWLKANHVANSVNTNKNVSFETKTCNFCAQT